jgi:hypothetical protein
MRSGLVIIVLSVWLTSLFVQAQQPKSASKLDAIAANYLMLDNKDHQQVIGAVTVDTYKRALRGMLELANRISADGEESNIVGVSNIVFMTHEKMLKESGHDVPYLSVFSSFIRLGALSLAFRDRGTFTMVDIASCWSTAYPTIAKKHPTDSVDQMYDRVEGGLSECIIGIAPLQPRDLEKH